MTLDPSIWDRLTKDQRYLILKGCLLMARAGSAWGQRDYTKPPDYAKLAIPAETVGETKDRLTGVWENAKVDGARAQARRLLRLDGGKR